MYRADTDADKRTVHAEMDALRAGNGGLDW